MSEHEMAGENEYGIDGIYKRCSTCLAPVVNPLPDDWCVTLWAPGNGATYLTPHKPDCAERTERPAEPRLPEISAEKHEELRKQVAEAITPWFNYYAPNAEAWTHSERLLGASNAALHIAFAAGVQEGYGKGEERGWHKGWEMGRKSGVQAGRAEALGEAARELREGGQDMPVYDSGNHAQIDQAVAGWLDRRVRGN